MTPRRSAARFEHRSLLDVELQVGARTTGLEGLPRLGHAVHVDAVLGQRVGETGALLIRQVANGVGHDAAAGAG